MPEAHAAQILAAGLAATGLRRVYGAVAALDDVSFRARPGEIVSLLGHSGCGKTTLLRIIAGVERPSSGTLRIDGLEVAGPARFVPPEARHVGLVFQDYALFPHLSILENVLFGLAGTDKREAKALALEALAKVGMKAHAGRYPHMLSGGEQQRVALARALAPAPRVMLMDEPFSNLDRRLRDEVRDQTMGLLRETGITAILVTHDPEEALRIADRIVLMRKGRVIEDAPGEEIYRRPSSLFSARFFCDLNLIGGTVRDGHVDTPLGRFPAPGLGAGAAAVLAIRPQGLKLAPGGAGPRARILAQHFLGETTEILLGIEGLDRPLKMRAAAAPRDENAVLAIDPDAVLIFPAAEESVTASV